MKKRVKCAVRKMKKANIAYLAGIIDGEGCITIYNRILRGKRNIVPIVQVTNCNTNLLEWIKNKTEVGKIYKVVRTKQPSNWKDLYYWDIRNGKNIEFLLKQLLPYLIIKKEHAIKMIEFLELRKIRRKRCRASITKEEFGYKKIFTILNKKGKVV